jgi:PAS domain S-box-containing protein
MVVQDTETVGLAAYRVLFEHNPEGVLFSTPDGRISAANPAACALLDMSGEEICQLGRDGLVDQEDPRWTIAVAERDRTESSVAVARLRRGDATSRIWRHLAAPETTEFVGSHVEASFGWATREAGDRTSLEDLVARSDWAMLEARDARRAAGRPDQA